MAILPLQPARVSNLLRTSVTGQNLSRTQLKLLEIQNQLATGKRINTPSDDPGATALAMQLRKVLENRAAYATNLQAAGSQLSEVDSAMGELTDILRQAQTLASSMVGSDVTADQRISSAVVAQGLFNKLLSLGNRNFQGTFLFAGDRATKQPFEEIAGGVRFVGSERTLKNIFDEKMELDFQVNGARLFGALSTSVQGSTNLGPALTLNTRLTDLAGATNQGVRLGAIRISDGTNSGTVELAGAETIQDVISRINAAAIGSVTATINPAGDGLRLSAGAGDNITVTDVVGGTTAQDLGIRVPGGAGVGVPLDGAPVQPKVTKLTPITALRGGLGLDPSGLTITSGATSATIDLAGVVTVEDLLNKLNGAGVSVNAQISASGFSIDIQNASQGVELRIGENGGSTAAQLGVRSFSATSALGELNDGRGVRTVNGADFRITNAAGVAFDVDISSATTIQDVINAINTASGGASASVVASFATTGNGIVLTDGSGGGGTMRVDRANFSFAPEDLGILKSATGTTLSGDDVNPVVTNGPFGNLIALKKALEQNDQAGITAAAERLQTDLDRVIRVRGETGARLQDFEARQQRLEDQNIATKALLSNLEDVDFTAAISRLATLQTQLQASLQAAGATLNTSLLDFLR